MNPIKLLIITGSFFPMKCGVGDYTYHLARSLEETNELEVKIVTSLNAKSPELEFSESHLNAEMKSWDLTEMPKLIKIVREYEPDVIHIQYPTQGYKNKILPKLLPFICYLLGYKVVQTWHEIYKKLRFGVLPQIFTPGKVIVVRPNYYAQMGNLLRRLFNHERLVYIGNASSIPKSELKLGMVDECRYELLKGKSRLLVFFGFIYEHKGIDQILEIANPEHDRIIIIGAHDESDNYYKTLLDTIQNSDWQGSVTFLGFLPKEQIADILSVADAVVLPFTLGGGEWNTSIHAATLQGTFVLTTSLTLSGYDETMNVYYSEPGDLHSMKIALDRYCGKRLVNESTTNALSWRDISNAHLGLYKDILSH
jgi:glycosyltransferase involved in cell wall biosynthesis